MEVRAASAPNVLGKPPRSGGARGRGLRAGALLVVAVLAQLEAAPRDNLSAGISSEHELRHTSRDETQHRTILSSDSRLRAVVTVRERPGADTVVRTGISSPRLDLGPAALRGLHRVIASPLSFGVRSTVFREPTDVRLDAALLPTSRSGGELRFGAARAPGAAGEPRGAEGTDARGRVHSLGLRAFGHRTPSAGETVGAAFSARAGPPPDGRHAGAASLGRSGGLAVAALGAISRPPEARPRDEWELEREPYPGGTLQHMALSAHAAAPRGTHFGALGDGGASITVLCGLSGGARVAPGGFLEGRTAFEPRLASLLLRAGMADPSYRGTDGAAGGIAARRSADLELFPRGAAGVLGFFDQSVSASEFYHDPESPAERRYGGGLRFGFQGRDGVWGRLRREVVREHSMLDRRDDSESADSAHGGGAEYRDELELRVRAGGHSVGFSLQDRRAETRLLQRRGALEYERRGSHGLVRTRARATITEEIVLGYAVRAELWLGRVELLAIVESFRDLPIATALERSLREPEDAVVATVGLRLRF